MLLLNKYVWKSVEFPKERVGKMDSRNRMEQGKSSSSWNQTSDSSAGHWKITEPWLVFICLSKVLSWKGSRIKSLTSKHSGIDQSDSSRSPYGAHPRNSTRSQRAFVRKTVQTKEIMGNFINRMQWISMGGVCTLGD